jgi:hypothetical protein
MMKNVIIEVATGTLQKRDSTQGVKDVAGYNAQRKLRLYIK